MDARHRGIQILGWLSVIAGYGLALLLFRGIFIGITRGFFGWGRMLLGALLIFGAVTTQFHLFPTRVKPLEYENQTQAAAGHVTTIAICIGCVFLILWGFWKGFGRQTIKPDLDS